MMDNFTTREVVFHKLPVPKGGKLLHPNKVVLDYGDGYTIDIGGLCYIHRSDKDRRRGKSWEVEISSFSEERSHSVRDLIEYISDEVENKGLSIRTLTNSHKSFVRFINYSDRNNHSNFFTKKTCPRTALRAYISHLQRLVSQNLLNNNTATGYQNEVLAFCEGFFDLEYLDQGINLLTKSRKHTEPTIVPDDDAQAKVLSWCKCLLNGFSKLVVDQHPYPFPLTVPGYLNWPNNIIWVFPTHRWCETPEQKTITLVHKSISYDYQYGKLRTEEELHNKYGIPKNYSREYFNKAQKIINKANQNFHHNHRIERGLLAIKAFAMLFIASTGMNPSQVFELPWSRKLEDAVNNPINVRQNFCAIKYRANNRPVVFEIGIEYMPYLRRFLLLRTYLLDGKTCKYLFFTFGLNQKSAPKVLNNRGFSTFYITLRRLTPSLPKVLPKEWRAAKQDYLIRNYDPATSSIALQQDIDTGLRNYSNGSEINAQIEMSSYLNRVEQVVLKQGTEIAGSRENSVGICASPNHPKAIAEHLPVKPNCDGAQGCLFCDKYRVHADEKDARKLLSARFCIRIIAGQEASNPDQFEQVFGQVIQRIEFILGEIKLTQRNIVMQVEREVDIDGKLDPIWQLKLEKLMTLGFVLR